MTFHLKRVVVVFLIALLMTVPAMAEDITGNSLFSSAPTEPDNDHDQVKPRPGLEKYMRSAPAGYRWIDRVTLDNNMSEAYAALEEATDADGVNDYLIEDKYYGSKPNQPKTAAKVGDIRCRTVNGSTVTEMLIWQDQLDFDPKNQELFNQYQSQVLDQVTLMYTAFLRDHPEVFWLNGMSWSWERRGTEYRLYMVLSSGKMRTIKDENSLKALIQERDNNVRKIVEGGHFTEKTTDLEKVQYFNQWLTHNNQYQTGNLDQRDAHNCIWALRGSVGTSGPVCEGYAKAFQILCISQNIPCVLVDGANHMWNNVKVDGTWYAMDVTWNDPTSGSGATSGHERESYTLVGTLSKISVAGSTSEFQRTHPVRNELFPGYAGVFNRGPVLSTVAHPASKAA